MEPGKVIKTFKSQKGKLVIIRYLKKDDLDAMLAFANRLIDEDTFVLLSGRKVTRKEEQTLLTKTLEEMTQGETIHLVVEVNGRYAGNASVHRKKYRKHHVGEPGIALDAAFRGEGIGPKLFKALIDESKKLGLRLLTLSCFENNSRAFEMYQKLGFKRLGIIPGAVLFKKSYIGEVVMYLPLT